MATDNELAVNKVAEDLFLELGRIPKYGEVRKLLLDTMSEKPFARYYPRWKAEKEKLLKNAQQGAIEGEVPVPPAISEAFHRAWSAEVQAMRADFAAQLTAAKVAMGQEVRDLVQQVQDGEEATELLAEQLDEARRLLADEQHEAKLAAEKISTLQLDNGVMAAKAADLEKQLAESNATNSKLNEEVKKTIGNLGAVEGKLTSAEIENGRLTRSLANQQEQSVTLQAEIIALTQRLAQSENTVERLKEELATLRPEKPAGKTKAGTAKPSEPETGQSGLPTDGSA